MDAFKLLDVVVLIEALPELKLRKGELGTIVELIAENTFLVEFADLQGVTYAMPVLTAKQLMKVYQEPWVA